MPTSLPPDSLPAPASAPALPGSAASVPLSPPLPVPASAPAPTTTGSDTASLAAELSGGLLAGLLSTVLALAFVLALAWVFLRLLKRATTLRSVDGRTPPQVVQAVALGGRERLIVVRDGAHDYVLGVTAASIHLIDKKPAAPLSDKASTPEK